MRPQRLLPCALALLLLTPIIALGQSTETVMISYGITETAPQNWEGQLNIRNGMLTNLTGYRFGTMDKIVTVADWQSYTNLGRIPRVRGNTRYIPLWTMPVTRNSPSNYSSATSRPDPIMKAVLSQFSATSSTHITLTTNFGDVDFRPADLAWGERLEFLAGNGLGYRGRECSPHDVVRDVAQSGDG